jgi:hypothetical protein
VNAETLTYEAFSLGPHGGRTLIGQGTRQYTVRDVMVEAFGGESPFWSKDLLLFSGFSVGARIFREQTLDGFGLVVRRRDDKYGFSWEWFDRDHGDIFAKLQGSGRVRVSVIEGPGYQELAGVEFLDDITLRYLDDMMSHQVGENTHEIVVKKGSVLRVAPQQGVGTDEARAGE